MVVLTQPVMQIRSDERIVKSTIDKDSHFTMRISFLRRRGLTVEELLQLPSGHEVFQEDDALKNFIGRVKSAVNWQGEKGALVG
jgi:hypothetical protein